MSDSKFVVDNDWTRNWEASIAVKITAVVIWALVVASIALSAILLHNVADTLNRQDVRNEEALTTRVKHWLEGEPAATTEAAQANLEQLIAEYGFVGLRITDKAREHIIGTVDAHAEPRPIQTIRYADATGSAQVATIALFQEPIAARVAEKRSRFMIDVLVALFLFGAFLIWVTNRIVASPFQKVVETMRRVTAGELSLRLDVDRKDEYGHLAEFFNSMLESINQKQTELTIALSAAERADKAKSTFLANMSHEMRTPLTAVLGFAETLLDPKLCKTEHDTNVRTIMRTGSHLLNVINDILDLGKIEADRLTIERVALSPFQLLTELRTSMEFQARAKSINFEINYEYPIPTTITSDPLRLKQILLNLCSNAVKFTSSGTVTVNVRSDVDQSKITFEVIDTGIGMTEEQLNTIFTDFVQADSSITKKFGGTGLGLVISRRLAALLSGELSVTSKPNVGSRFKLTVATGSLAGVPLVRRRDQPPTIARPSDVPSSRAPLNGRVLVAEDNADNQALTSFLLRQFGLSVSVVENGQRAVEFALSNPVDLILMDVQMPVMDGLAATEHLRKVRFARPIIALTANAFREDRDHCVAAGCNEMVTKPIDVNFLYETLARYLPPAIVTDTTPAIDTTWPATPNAATFFESDHEFQSLVAQFLENLPRRLEAIDSAAQHANWPEVRAAAHALKGIGGSYGYDNVTKISAEIERAAMEANATRCAELIGNLRDILRDARDSTVTRVARRGAAND